MFQSCARKSVIFSGLPKAVHGGPLLPGRSQHRLVASCGTLDRMGGAGTSEGVCGVYGWFCSREGTLDGALLARSDVGGVILFVIAAAFFDYGA